MAANGALSGLSEGWGEAEKWGNKPGKFIFPRGLPFKFRPSKNGTPNGNRSHNDVYNYRAPIDGARETGFRLAPDSFGKSERERARKCLITIGN